MSIPKMQSIYISEIILGPSEENINILMEMGFTRERVTQALRETNNDLELATVILLQQ